MILNDNGLVILDSQCKEQLNNYYFKSIKHLLLKAEKLHDYDYELWIIHDLRFEITNRRFIKIASCIVDRVILIRRILFLYAYMYM